MYIKTYWKNRQFSHTEKHAKSQPTASQGKISTTKPKLEQMCNEPNCKYWMNEYLFHRNSHICT